MESNLLTPPFTAAALTAASTQQLKESLLKAVEGRESDRLSNKVKFASETLMPLFDELRTRNPTPELEPQIPLLKGTWLPVWSTNPFEDIIPGRIHSESYQIFSDRGYYANLARYRPGRKTPFLSWLAKRFLSYDFVIIQRYQIAASSADEAESVAAQAGEEYWDIQNVCIRRALRLGSPSFGVEAANVWFTQLLNQYLETADNQREDSSEIQSSASELAAQKVKIRAKQYQQIAKARPLLDHLYIDSDFRLIKTQREKSQRPSYTIATRLS